MAESDFLRIVLSNILVFIQLRNNALLFFECIDIEVLIVYDDLFVKSIQFSLFHSGFLCNHIIARDKHSIEVLLVRESWALDSNLVFEVRFAFCFGVILETFQLLFGLLSLQVIRNLKIFKH